MNNLVEQVEKTVSKYKLIAFGDKIIVALSGGADSVTLLDVLYSIKEKYNLTLYAAHINHNIRGEEAKRDENFCKILCEKYNIELFVKSADVKMHAKQQKISEELCGRNVRYDFFNELSDKLGAKTATAHTASDNAETLLFNLARGTSLAGISAIPPKRDNIIRPLIELTRNDIEKYCTENNIHFVTDSTNLTDDYTRNKIRHRLIPVMKEINPSFERSAANLSENTREVRSFLDNVSNTAIEDCRVNFGYDCNKLALLDIAVLKNSLIILCKKYNINPEQRHIDLLCNIIKDGGAVELSKECTAVSVQGIFRFAVNSETADFEPKNINTVTEFKYDGKQYSVKEIFCDGSSVNSVLLDKNCLSKSVDLKNAVFRTRLPGDCFTYPVRNVTKPLRKVLNEQKIPSELRDRLLVLAVNSTVLWCENIGASLQGKDENMKNVLKIEIKEV